MTKKWKCNVCGYLHEGEEPPEECPRCGAERSHFIELKEQKTNLIHDVVETFVLHPVAAHFPNGLLPTAFLFLLLGFVTGNEYFDHTALHLVIVVLCVVPVTMAAGIYDWRTKFHGVKARIFYKKIALATLLFLLAVAAVTVRGDNRLAYAVLLLAMLPVVGLLGHYGAKLVYHWEKSEL